MNFGVITSEPFSEYLSSEAVSFHRLEDIAPRPSVYYAKHVAKTVPPRGDTDAFRFGRLFHCLALEGEAEMEKRFAVRPSVDRRTKAGKESFEKWTLENYGKEGIEHDDLDLAWRMVRSVRSKKSACDLLTRGNPEVTFRHALKSFAVQARVDWFDREASAGPLCVNVKTVETLEDFDQQFERFGYYRSDAYYRLVVAKVLGIEPTAPQMVNLVCEKTAPFECAIRVPDAESLEIGTREVMRNLHALATCIESGNWPGAADEAVRVSLPAWRVKKELEAS